MISVTPRSLSAEQALLSLLDLRLPEALLLEEPHGRRVIRNGHVAPDRAIAGPLLEHGMDRSKLTLVIPQRLQRCQDRAVRHVLAGREVRVVRDEARILDDRGGFALLDPARVIPGHAGPYPLFPRRRTVVGDVTDADGRVRLLDLGRVEGVLRDVGAALQQ